MKRIIGKIELVFNSIYLLTALSIGLVLVIKQNLFLPGLMALVLVFGDAFHLVPRTIVLLDANKAKWQKALGRGKQITSITMTLFYLLLWHIGLSFFAPLHFAWTLTVYILAFVRIALCIFPQNKWLEENPPLSWGIYRNIPFFLQGLIVAVFFFINKNVNANLVLSWLAIVLSFAFYLPVVLWVHKKPQLGALMLPKSCVYIWIIAQFLFLGN